MLQKVIKGFFQLLVKLVACRQATFADYSSLIIMNVPVMILLLPFTNQQKVFCILGIEIWDSVVVYRISYKKKDFSLFRFPRG